MFLLSKPLLNASLFINGAALPFTRTIATPLPISRPGKSGVAAIKRAARKAHNRARNGRH